MGLNKLQKTQPLYDPARENFGAAEARTATVDGAGAGQISDDAEFVSVTAGADANSIITLPAPVVGKEITLQVGATGYELRTSDPATISLNNVSGAGKEAAIGANVTAVARCVSATAWILMTFTNLGAVATAIVPD